MIHRHVTTVLALVLSLGLVTAAAGAPQPNTESLLGQEAPNFTLKTLDGTLVTLSKVPEKVVVLDFWATWCGPCRKALPHLQEVFDWAKKENKAAAIYAVNLKEESDKVSAYWKEQKFTMPVLMDVEGKTANSYRVHAIPTTVVIVNRKVAKVFIGSGPDIAQQLQTLISDALSEQTTAPAAE